jgi:tetratricopeptide (TPR) repeat protein
LAGSNSVGARRIILTGLGGIGKTQLALEYLYRFRDDYSHVFWIASESVTAMQQSYSQLLSELGFFKDQATFRDLQRAFWDWLKQNDDCLLVYDNVEDVGQLRDLLPPDYGGAVIITTQSAAVGPFGSSIAVSPMDADEAHDFLKKRVGYVDANEPQSGLPAVDTKSAIALNEQLSGLPLALDQAGAFMDEAKVSAAEYLDLYLDRGKELRTLRGDYAIDHESVHTTIRLCTDSVRALSPGAMELLSVMAFLSPHNVPAKLVESILSATGAGSDTLAVAQAQRALVKYSLISRNTVTGELSVHRLVQDVIRDDLYEQDVRSYIDAGAQALWRVWPTVIDDADWTTCCLLASHAASLVGHGMPLQLMSADMVCLTSALGDYLLTIGELHKGSALQAAALHFFNVLKEENAECVDLVVVLVNNATLCRKLGALAEAHSFLTEALTLQENQQKRINEQLLFATYTELGHVCLDQGRPNHAIDFLTKAKDLAFDKSLTRSSLYGVTVSMLGGAYWGLKKYRSVVAVLEEALEEIERHSGPESPDLSAFLLNLAQTYTELKEDPQKAERYVERAKQVIGNTNDASDIAGHYNGLGQYYMQVSKSSEAIAAFQEAQNYIQTLPKDSKYASVYLNLGILLLGKGSYAEAEVLLKTCVDLLAEFGRETSYTAVQAYQLLARVASKRGNRIGSMLHADKAESLHRALKEQGREVPKWTLRM